MQCLQRAWPRLYLPLALTSAASPRHTTPFSSSELPLLLAEPDTEIVIAVDGDYCCRVTDSTRASPGLAFHERRHHATWLANSTNPVRKFPFQRLAILILHYCRGVSVDARVSQRWTAFSLGRTLVHPRRFLGRSTGLGRQFQRSFL